jgi:hypothetical protein
MSSNTTRRPDEDLLTFLERVRAQPPDKRTSADQEELDFAERAAARALAREQEATATPTPIANDRMETEHTGPAPATKASGGRRGKKHDGGDVGAWSVIVNTYCAHNNEHAGTAPAPAATKGKGREVPSAAIPAIRGSVAASAATTSRPTTPAPAAKPAKAASRTSSATTSAAEVPNSVRIKPRPRRRQPAQAPLETATSSTTSVSEPRTKRERSGTATAATAEVPLSPEHKRARVTTKHVPAPIPVSRLPPKILAHAHVLYTLV